jgi:hypothetical protein
VSNGGYSDADLLVRRARWLVRAYPAAYRAGRGEEIIGTLLEATPPGRNWPPSREAVSVIAAACAPAGRPTCAGDYPRACARRP